MNINESLLYITKKGVLEFRSIWKAFY